MRRFLRGLGVVGAALALMPGISGAEISEDIHITRDDHVRLDIDQSMFNEFKRFYDEGYPPASVMLHGISLGMAIEDLVYLAVTADRARADEFYETAVDLLPSLPGWSCRTANVDDRYAQFVSADQSGGQASIRAIADAWFDDVRALAPFPDWQNNQVHINASVAELSALVDEQKFWYQPGIDRDAPIFVGLYRDSREIVIDGGLSRINAAKAAGGGSVPVVLVFNHDHQRPLSRYGADATVADVASEFFSKSLEVTPVPEWKDGDFHMMASIDDIRSLASRTQQRDASEVSEDEMSAIRAAISSDGGAVTSPLLLTLLRTGNGEVWIDSPATLDVAESMGVAEVPVTLFFHDIDRQPCGAPSSCEEQICDAAVAAGGTPQCESGT